MHVSPLNTELLDFDSCIIYCMHGNSLQFKIDFSLRLKHHIVFKQTN